jgi:hypothetical protein
LVAREYVLTLDLKKDLLFLDDLERVMGIEYLTSIVKSMLPEEVVCLF